MVDYREILRRHSLGDSIRAIALGVNSSRDTVSATLRAASAAGVEWPLDDDVSNADISIGGDVSMRERHGLHLLDEGGDVK